MFRKTLAVLLLCALLLTGCAADSSESSSPSQGTTITAVGLDTSDLFTSRDMETGYDEDTAAVISLEGTTAVCDSDAVTIDGSTITITDEGTYLLSGTLEDGMVIVDADDADKVQIVLDNASITSGTSAALYIRNADKVFLTTAPDSENTLSSGDSFVAIDDNNIDAAVFSKSDLTLNGTGTLTVSSPAGHGIVSKDDLAVTSGTYQITAASQGLSGKDSVRIADGTFEIQSGKDGIHGENTDDTSLGFVYIANGSFSIQAEGDGISSSSTLQIDDGTFSIQAGGGSANGEDHTQNDAFGGGRSGGMKPGAAGTDGAALAEPPADPASGSAPSQEGTADTGADLSSSATAAADSTGGNTPSGGQPAAAPSEGSTDGTADTTEELPSTKGLKASQALVLTGGSFSLDTADDALHSNGDVTITGGTYSIATGDDGVHADNAVSISDCTMDILESYEGLEGLTVTITGGTISVTASDDGVNAAGGADSSGFGGGRGDAFAAQSGAYIAISGGSLTVDAGGDGLDSNGDLYITGGTTLVAGPTSGADSALDHDGQATITGGIFAATGSVGMAQTFSADGSTQPSMLIAVSPDSVPCTITVRAADGTELFSWETSKNFSSFQFSSPELELDATYTVTAGGNSTDVTLDTLSYQSEGVGGMGGGRGGMERGERPDRALDGTSSAPGSSGESESEA